MIRIQFYRIRHGKRHKIGEPTLFGNLDDVVKAGITLEGTLRRKEFLQWKIC